MTKPNKANEAPLWALGELRELGIKTRGLPVKEARRKAVERINWLSHNQVCPSSGKTAHYFRRWAKVLCYNAFVRGRLGLPTNAYLTREQGGLSVWKK